MVLNESITERDTINLFSDDDSICYSLVFYSNDVIKSNESNSTFQPLAFHPDNFLLCFIVAEVHDDHYMVIVNNEQKMKVYKTGFFEFLEWDEFLLNKPLFVRPKNKESLFKSPGVESEKIELPDTTNLIPVEIVDDWLRVSWNSNNSKRFGWIKWCNEYDILIEIFYF